MDLGPLLGRGAHGAVYRGMHRTLGIEVAVKLLGRSEGSSSELERTLEDARLMARLDHPNLLRLYDAGQLDDAIYLVMEHVDGGSLAGRHHQPADALLAIAHQMLGALQALHDARFVHRDVRPANCLIRRRDGRVKLADLAVISDPAATAGPFIAPELRTGAVADVRSDLHALGATLAAAAFDADPPVIGPVPPVLDVRPDLPPSLASLVDRLVAPRPGDRPASAADALAALAAAEPARAPGSAIGPDLPRIGPWQLGEQTYSSPNWRGFAVTHVRTGAAARLSHLEPRAPLGRGEIVVESAERASTLDHPGFVAVLDWGTHDGRPYVVVSPHGRDLVEIVRTSGPMPEHEALGIIAGLADALAHLHGRGLVYQSVNPGSATVGADARAVQWTWPILCVPSGTPNVDAQGVWRRGGVPEFMPPEAFPAGTRHSQGSIDPPADVYGLGEILYYLLVGRSAFEDAPTLEMLAIAKMSPPDLHDRAPEATRPTVRLVTALLQPDAAVRPSAAETRGQALRIAARLGGQEPGVELRTEPGGRGGSSC